MHDKNSNHYFEIVLQYSYGAYEEFMKEFSLKKFLSDHFVVLSAVFSFLISALYFLKGFQSGFLWGTWIVIGMNLIYIPFVFIFRQKSFPVFFLLYAVILIFLTAFEKTLLLNNFTPLFIVCIVIGLRPKWKWFSLAAYFSAICIAFALNEEPVICFLIHIVRSFWFILCVLYVLDNYFDRKKIVLYEDERKILDQLLDGKVYQKEVEGFSENTIYRKLKAARERNGCKTREELLEKYRDEKEAGIK